MNTIVALRHFKLALLAAFALGLIGAGSGALAATTATASASATVIAPIAVSSTANLSFGKFAPGAGGSVTINTAGSRTVSGVIASGGTPTAATFDITGEPSATYAIDTSATTANLNSGANTMALALISDFTGGGATSGTQATGTLDGTGKQTLHVGGVLTVSASQPNGSYSGTISVAVAYN
jgi:hypothetical protein